MNTLIRVISGIIPQFNIISELVITNSMKSSKHYFACFVLLASTSSCLTAKTEDHSLALLGSEEMYLEDLPIVISATKLAQPINEAPVSTTVIDRQMIEASGAQTIADLLRLAPGFTVGYLNGAIPVATYHGQSDRYSKRVQLLIDGRSVYLPTLAGVSWSDLIITIDDIERIEIVRGPNASTYGNNAFQSVVSITTRHPSDEAQHYLKNTIGSHDTADVIYRFAGHSDDLEYRVSVGTKNNEGTDLLDDFTESDYLSYRMDYQINHSTQLYYSGGFQDSTYGDALENSDDTDNDVDIDTGFQHLKFEHSYNDQSSLSLQYYYNYTKSFDFNILFENFPVASFDPLTLLDLSALDSFDVTQLFELESERHDLELDYYYNLGDSLRLVSGASIRADKITADSVFHPDSDDTLLLYRVFTHGEYQLNDNWLFNAGLMFESNDISGSDISPRLAVIHHLNTKHTLRLSASKATRTPTLFDENGFLNLQQQLTQNGGQALNNPALEAALGGDILTDTLLFSTGNVDSEEIISLELGWMAQLLDNKLTLDFKIFADETNQIIADVPFTGSLPTENIDVLDPTNQLGDEFTGARDQVNAASTASMGIEITSDYQISPDWRLYAYYAYIELDAKIMNKQITDTGTQEDIVGQLEESIPSNSYGAMLMKQWDNHLNTSLSVYHVDDMDWLDRTRDRDNPVSQPHLDRSAEAYTRVDFVLRKSVVSGNNQIDYSFILQNLNGSYFDYTRTNYTDSTRQTVDIPGSEQDPRGYFELAIKFN